MMTAAARQISEYKAVRERLYGKPKVVNIAVERAKRIESERAEAKAEWEIEQELKRMSSLLPKPVEKAKAEFPAVIFQSPSWMICATHFNQHVVDWLMSKIEAERDDVYGGVVKRTMKQITLEVLADFPGVSIEDLKGRSRTHEVVIPRQLAMYRIYQERLDLSFPDIGRWFGGRDHTTALHSVKKCEAKYGIIPREKTGKKRSE